LPFDTTLDYDYNSKVFRVFDHDLKPRLAVYINQVTRSSRKMEEGFD